MHLGKAIVTAAAIAAFGVAAPAVALAQETPMYPVVDPGVSGDTWVFERHADLWPEWVFGEEGIFGADGVFGEEGSVVAGEVITVSGGPGVPGDINVGGNTGGGIIMGGGGGLDLTGGGGGTLTGGGGGSGNTSMGGGGMSGAGGY